MTTPHIERQRREHVRMMERERKQTIEQYLKVDGRKQIVDVDWVRLVNDHDKFIQMASDGVIDEIYDDMVSYLLYKGRLSDSGKQGSFFIWGAGMDLSIRDSSGKYSFPVRGDAEKFKEAKYVDTDYHTE